ncbi:ATP-binding protein [Undibacterium terreum]|uniref:histidine kinase n=1 Tax=Undibacterium terreum TaxID=1224302 RepID=A0A916U870_9BURK|nr:ATP-binding protein [Undibacterium terreum]GGC62756.1 two-component sensor histidine kinase [Undibacterium terreum]
MSGVSSMIHPANPSVRRTLLVWLSVGILAGIVFAGSMIYMQVREQANQLFDYQMKQLVASLPAQSYAPLIPTRPELSNMQEDIIIQIWDSQGLRIYHSHDTSALPQRAELGFSNFSAHGTTWRVYSAQLGDTIVQVAQPLSARLELAARLALKTVAPLLLILPFLAALIWFAVGRSLSAVQRAATDVQSRDAGALTPISEAGVPQEVQPLTRALNELLQRLDISIQAQRNFIADAAHELKTPLTALKLQILLAERAGEGPQREEAFADLKQGLERAIHLVQQLLTLARQEPGAVEQVPQVVDMQALVRAATGDFAMAANDKEIDLGVQADTPAQIMGHPDGIRILLNNLLDNAIRYSPRGSAVDVSLLADADTVSLCVQDNGPGIPEGDLSRVFDRFYRVPGSQSKGTGLGLAIVRQIAEAHRAEVVLTNTGKGLLVRVVFGRELLPAAG